MVQLNKLVFHVPRHTDIIRHKRQERCCFPGSYSGPAAEKAAHWPASCDVLRVQNSGGFREVLTHGNRGGWKRQDLWRHRSWLG